MGESPKRERSTAVYDFVHPGHRLAAEWPVLELVHQRFVEALCKRLDERFKVALEARSTPTRRSRYADFVADVDGAALVHELSLGPLPGVALLCLDAALVPALVDAWFGGTPTTRTRDAEAPPPVPSATERRALGHVLDAVTAALGESWAELAAFTPTLARTTTPARLARGGYGDVVVDCPFSLAPGEDALGCRLVYPAAALEPFAEALSQEDHSHPVHEAGFRDALSHGLMDCELELRGVLAETRITLAELMALKPGDFIPLKDVQNVSFRTRNTPLFDARVGNANGRVSASLSGWHLPIRP